MDCFLYYVLQSFVSNYLLNQYSNDRSFDFVKYRDILTLEPSTCPIGSDRSTTEVRVPEYFLKNFRVNQLVNYTAIRTKGKLPGLGCKGPF